jgi:xanthine dehydrogenase YagR molybdenum-binding subunit
MKRDGLTLGWGMAACAWLAVRFPAEASVELRDDGTARLACGTQDIGTGTYTILAQLISEKTGVPVEKVEVVLGDNALGARGIGEIGLAGFAAAVTDAVHHATGIRVRELPVKIEDLLASA